MRIADLTPARERALLAARRRADRRGMRVARRICEEVRRGGDAALRRWARRLDGAGPGRIDLLVDMDRCRRALEDLEPARRRALEHAARNIRRVALRQLPRPWSLEVEPGVTVEQAVRPLEAVGCYVPGGRFPLVSSLLMTAVPARAAGVERVVVASPRPGRTVLAAAALAGVDAVHPVGGAQAVAALAYGTGSIDPVSRIVGPGNRYVAAAKRHVSADCGVDLDAGPTELVVLARRGRAASMAADLLAQAEHDPEARSLLVTPSRSLARRVAAEVARQAARLPRGNPARASLRRHGLALVAPTLREAVAFVNRYAPEHLSLRGGERDLLDGIDSAGGVFLGEWAAQPLGDFVTGSNHTLPTSGWARVRGGLSAADFVKCISVQRVTRSGFRRVAGTAALMAAAEGLEAHRRAVEVRS